MKLEALIAENEDLKRRNTELVTELMEKSADLSEACEERDRIKLEVKVHRDQTGHNMCWLNDVRLWLAVLGPEAGAYPHNLIPAESEFVGVGCKAYFESRYHTTPNPFVMPPYRKVDELAAMIDEPYRGRCQAILRDNRELFQTIQGSTNNHQAWLGGYWDHVSEVMNIAVLLYNRLNPVRKLPFTLSDALLVVFLHDIEKPWKYEMGEDGQLRHKPELDTKQAQHEFRNRKLAEYGFLLSAKHKNAMQYVEGEFADYSNRRRVMGPLAAFCHLCDVTSARIWFDHPATKDDPWPGAAQLRG